MESTAESSRTAVLRPDSPETAAPPPSQPSLVSTGNVEVTKSHQGLRISTHPLFPLLRRAALLCALCATRPSSGSVEGGTTPTSIVAALDEEIVETLKESERTGVKLLGSDPEIENLVRIS